MEIIGFIGCACMDFFVRLFRSGIVVSNAKTFVRLLLLAICLICANDILAQESVVTQIYRKTYTDGVYEGTLVNGVREGQGTKYFTNGDKYVGEYKDDKRNGQGTYTWSSGNKYVGEFKDDKIDGQGTKYFTSGDKYVGEWKDDKFNGQGTYTWPNGHKYVGEYKDDERNGHGTYTWSNGNKYVGEFKDDKIDGQGTKYFTNGDKYVGEFKDGKFNGQGTKYYKNGEVESGIWENDKFVGPIRKTTEENVTNLKKREIPHYRRIALVMGNAEYENENYRLRNPVNDATDVTKKLKVLGFKVIPSFNKSKQEMEQDIEQFRKQASNYDVALFYYSGHGIQCDGTNYLVPTDAELPEKAYIQYRCVNVNMILDLMDNCQMKIVILDACRNTPFAKSWNRGTYIKGLATVNASQGTLIAYATSPGMVAADGTGRNSPYTSALLQAFDVPNLSIFYLFPRVTANVRENTNGEQVPWTSSSLTEEFIFNEQ
ncbi:MAG: caspase family protein [Bacteroidales bacterium]|nr:caspase family protein [Bacteroidales bacterium]